MGGSRYVPLGAAVPRCGAWTRSGGRCAEPPALHPENPGFFVSCGRCHAHGGRSTGPRSAEGKAAVAAAARRLWNAVFAAEGKVRPSEDLRRRAAAFLESRTWRAAMAATGLSRRALERIERGVFCDEAELAAVKAALPAWQDEGPTDGQARAL